MRNGNVSFNQLVGVGICVEEAWCLWLDVQGLPINSHILTIRVLLSIDSGEEHIELQITSARCYSYFDHRVWLILMPAAVPQDYLLHNLALVSLSTHQTVIKRP